MRRQGGQATVEVALVLPLVALLLLGVVQVGLVVANQVAITHAAREAARAAAAGATDDGARRSALAASDLADDRTTVTVTRAAGVVRATVRYRDTTDVPLVGPLLPAVDLTASVAFADERAP